LATEPIILVTNDDGIVSPGIRALVQVASQFGKPIIVAPDSPQSAKGHAITLMDPIRLKRVEPFPGIEAYECSGTPVDCVKLAKNVILKDRNVALCVSGINHGSNASINIIYSGTVSAAMEASLEGVPSIGFSLLNYSFEADFEPAKHFARQIIQRILENGMGKSTLLNVNIPNLPKEQIRGVKICRQAEAKWVEEFQETIDPRGEPYYWMTGKFQNQDPGEDTDIWALENGYVSMVPAHHDLTDYPSISSLKQVFHEHA